MRIGTKGHYALAAMIELAKRSADGGVISLRFLALHQNVPLNYLEILCGKLKKSGLLESVRGALGGYFLALPPKDITVWDVITAVGEGMRVNRCPTMRMSGAFYCFDKSDTCSMHPIWEELGSRIQSYLQGISLQDIIDQAPAVCFTKIGPDQRSTSIS